MSQLFTTILYQPLLNLLVFFYTVVPGHDIGVAIVLLTIIIKLLLYPLSRQSIRGQKSLQQLQPKMNELKERYKNDREAQAKAMMALYKAEKVNPLSSCLPLLIQLPILLAVFQVFQSGLHNGSLDLLYPFVADPGSLNPVSFGLVNLAQPNLVLALLAGAAQYWQAQMLSTARPPKKMPGAKDEDMMTMMNRQMLYVMPVMTVFIGMTLPGGLALYWFIITLLTALQQQVMFRKDGPPAPKTTPAAPATNAS